MLRQLSSGINLGSAFMEDLSIGLESRELRKKTSKYILIDF